MEPGSRDRFIDLLRGGSIVAVVVGHWLVADVRWVDVAGPGRLVETSSLHEVPAMWPLTWLFVVIPLFFFVGGLVDGALTRPVAVGMTVGGLGVTALLVAFGPYTATMVGVTDGPVGNMHPPTLAITALGIAQIGIALLLREPLTRWLARPRVWAAVVVVNLSVMSIYLWHQAALTIAARLVLPLGYPDPTPGTPQPVRVRISRVPSSVVAATDPSGRTSTSRIRWPTSRRSRSCTRPARSTRIRQKDWSLSVPISRSPPTDVVHPVQDCGTWTSSEVATLGTQAAFGFV